KAEVDTKRSQLVLTAIFNNTGRSSVAVKEVGLLRIQVGNGNYANIKVKIADYTSFGGISASSTKVLTLSSDSIEKQLDEDQKLLTTYWRTSVPAVLFVEDNLGTIHASNVISFSPGLYERTIYDRLASEAARSKAFQSSR